MKQMRWLDAKYTHFDRKVPVYIILAHSVAKASYGRIPAVHFRWGFKPQPLYSETTGELIEHNWRPFTVKVEEAVDPADLPPGVDPDGDHTKVVERHVQRICCPECGQPIMAKKDEYADWDWLCRGRRICRNEITIGRLEIKDDYGREAFDTETRYLRRKALAGARQELRQREVRQ